MKGSDVGPSTSPSVAQPVGNLSDARAALSDGGQLVAEGNYRRVRRIGDVVYKIDISSSRMNESEFRVAEEGRPRLPHNIVIPPMTLHDVDGVMVLAMPFIVGDSVGLCPQDDAELEEHCDDCVTCLPVEVARLIEAVTPDGITRGNTFRQGDIYVIIDLDYPPDPLADSVIRT